MARCRTILIQTMALLVLRGITRGRSIVFMPKLDPELEKRALGARLGPYLGLSVPLLSTLTGIQVERKQRCKKGLETWRGSSIRLLQQVWGDFFSAFPNLPGLLSRFLVSLLILAISDHHVCVDIFSVN